MTPEQLAALGIELIANAFTWSDEAGEYVQKGAPLVTHSDLMKVSAAYEARIAELEGAVKAGLTLLGEYYKEVGGCDHSVGICMCSDFAVGDRMQDAISQSSPLTALEEYRKKVRVETLPGCG